MRGAKSRLARLTAVALGLAGAALVPPAQGQGAMAIGSDSVRVVYWEGDRGIADRTLAAALAPLPLPGIGRVPGMRAGTIYLAPDPARFDSLTGGRAPDWSAGVAIPSLRVIVLPAYPSSRTLAQDPTVALRHELVHLALSAYLGGPGPRWFDEGYATWASGGWDASAGWQIRLALLRGVAPPLDSLSLRWPTPEPQARLAYLLSASAVEFLARRNGERGFREFLQAWRREGSIDPAIRGTYLMTLDGFEREWREMVKRRYGWLLALAQIGFFWVFATGVVLAMGVLRRRRNRARMAAMEEEERLNPTPYEEEVLDAEVIDDEPEDGVDDDWRRG